MSTTAGLHILGLSGGTMPTYAVPDAVARSRFPADPFHDAAAVLVCDGEVTAAIEEERLNRLKHTNRLPLHAIRACLGLSRSSVDRITRFAYYAREDLFDRTIATYMLQRADRPSIWSA